MVDEQTKAAFSVLICIYTISIQSRWWKIDGKFMMLADIVHRAADEWDEKCLELCWKSRIVGNFVIQNDSKKVNKLKFKAYCVVFFSLVYLMSEIFEHFCYLI